MKKVILIGGSPTAGKTFVAKKLSAEFNYPWISTDIIREQMRKLVRQEDYPILFRHAHATTQMGVKFLTQNSVSKIIKHVNEEDGEVWKGVKALIESAGDWDSYIIEGVGIPPKKVAELKKKRREIKAVFLIDEDISRVRKTIFTRGLWDAAHKYPHSVKEKEVEWVTAHNKYIKKEAQKYGFPVISISDRKTLVKRVKKLI
jgi:2-phosphoglycerate kinase